MRRAPSVVRRRAGPRSPRGRAWPVALGKIEEAARLKHIGDDFRPAQDVGQPVDRAPGDEGDLVGLSERRGCFVDVGLDEPDVAPGALARSRAPHAIASAEKSSPVAIAPRWARLIVSSPIWHWRWTSRFPATSPISAASMACRQSPPAITSAMPVHAGGVGRMQLRPVVPVQPVGGDELVHVPAPNEKRRRSAAYCRSGRRRPQPLRLGVRSRLARAASFSASTCGPLGREQVAHLLVQALGADVRRLGDARRLAAPAAEVIELGAAHLAAAHHLDLLHHRRIDREHALHAFTVGDLANREALLAARRPCGRSPRPHRPAGGCGCLRSRAHARAPCRRPRRPGACAWRRCAAISACSICWIRFILVFLCDIGIRPADSPGAPVS